MKRHATIFLAALLGLGHAPGLLAAACSNDSTGNWSAAGTWAAPCNVAGGPTAADTVTIINNTTVTVDGARAANSLTIATGNANTTLTFAAGSSLAVTNDVIINRPTQNFRTKSITVLTGTLTVGGDVTMTGGTAASRDALLTVSSGLITINGGLIINSTVATSSTASITAAGGRITVNGAAGVTNGDRVTVGTGTFSVTNPAATFDNANGALAVLTSVSTGTLSIAGNLTNAAGETVQLTGAGTITVNGTVTNNGTYTVGTGTANAGTFTNNGVVTVSSGLIDVTGDYTNTAGGDTVTISAAGGRLTVAGTLTNGGTVTAGTGTVNAATFTNNNAVTVSTGLIDVTGAYTNTAVGDTITITGAGGRLTVGGTLTNAGSIIFNTAAGGIVNANGDFVSSGTVTNTTAGTINITGNATVNGTFTAGAGTVVFTGGAAQTLTSGIAITYNNLTINKSSNNVTITCATPSPTVNTTLALTSGSIVTSGTSPGCLTTCPTQVPIIVAAAGTITGGSSTSYVQGALRKLFSAAGTLNFRAVAGQDEFPVGDASNYTPIEITAGTTSTAGNITACVTPAEHPQVTTPPVASGGINAAKSVNRYWSLTTSTINTTAALVNATFKFVAGDVDGAATTGNFIVEDWNGTSWTPTTLVAAGATSTQASSIDLTGATNEFAIGEPLSGFTSVPGRYNAFETSTPAGILGWIQTKVAGTAFSVDIVHINANKTGVLAGAITVEVRLLDSSGGGALDADGCNAAWPLIQALPNFNIPASGRGTIPAATVNNSYPSVRFQIRSPVGGPYTQIGCSTDLFAIRPQSLTITAHDATWATAGTGRALANVGASGGNVHKASTSGTPLPFTLRATPVPASATNYDGNPTTVSGFPSCTGLGALCTNLGTFDYTAGSWTAAGSGVRENATATYSEAGAFNLQLEDTVYASVDAVDGTPAGTRTVPATADAQIGRFVPDHFDVTTLVAPTFKTFNAADGACSAGAPPRRTFTYIGQPFGYLTTLQATVIARNAAGATTTNYAGTLWKIGGASPGTAKDCTADPNICQFTTSWAAGGDSSTVIENYTYALTPVSTPNWDNAGATPAAATVTAGTGVNAGTGTITYASSDALAFKRNTAAPQATFTAAITNTVSVQDASEAALNGTITTTTAAAFSSIAFDSGNEFRYGRLQFLNAHGSGLLALDVPIQVEYWNGTLWLRNAADHCTSVGSANFALGNVTGFTSTSVSGGGTISGGGSSITLAKPTGGTSGTVDVTINLGATGTANATPCPAWAPAPAATALNAPYLQSQCAGAGSYNRDPSARATFGIYRNKFILLRENY